MMAITEKQRHDLKRFVKELEVYRGRHTELVSVYIPQGYEMTKIINHLDQEKGTATNIKSASTRKNVIDALEKMTQHLKLFTQTPKNGLAVFSGNVAEREGQQNFQVWSIEPPVPLNTRIYRCDKEFQLDLLRDMLETKDLFGLVIVDRRDAIIAHLKGKSIIPLLKTHSEVPGKTRAGGQCGLFGTVIQSATGSLIKIENCHNPHVVKSMITDNLSIKDSPITDKWITKKQEIYKIITKYPQLIFEGSKDHVFFVATNEGIVEKAAEDLKKGEILLMPEKIEVKGNMQKLRTKRYYNSFVINQQGRTVLKKERKKQRLLQRQFGKKVGLTQTAISFIEIAKRNPRREPLKKICKSLNLGFDEFLEEYTKPNLQEEHQNVRIKLPEVVDEQFAQFLGYYMGDGCAETDRITFFEQRKEVALEYKKLFDVYFGISSGYRFRENKNYHQLRFVSRPLVRLIKKEFPELRKTLDSEIPLKILESPNKIVGKFLKGLFDAEGWVNIGYVVGIALNNKTVMRQVQMLLLRFSILSSFSKYDNKKNPYSNNPIYKVTISERESLRFFRKLIGFTSEEKLKNLDNLIKRKADTNRTRQILVSGKEVRKIIEKSGYNLELFPKVSNFFQNKRMMSKEIFKNSILSNIKDKKLHKKLKDIYDYSILPVKISKIEVSKKPTKMVDISVKDQSFIANGLFVHNSAARFERLREGAKVDHFKKVAEYMKEQFLNDPNLKGIIVGGPGPTKHDFIEGGHLTNEVRKKIIAVKDLSYTGDFGLQELLEKSEDVLAEEAVIEEKQAMNRFFQTLSSNQNMVSYGEQEVMKHLKMGAVETLLLSETLDDKKIEEFEKESEQFGTKVMIISTETREGSQLKDIGKVAALLRYKVQR